MDIPNTAGNVPPHLAKNSPPDYYNPEYETQRMQNYNSRLFGVDNVGNQFAESRRYEDYRKPSNLYGALGTLTDPESLYVATYTNPTAQPSGTKTLGTDVFQDLFTGNLGGGNVNYVTNTEVRLMKKSPIRPPAMITGVS